MPKPNFLIIGAGKSGTSSLYFYLRQHPEIYMSPVKEPNFFGFEPNDKLWNGPIQSIRQVRTFEEYLTLFDQVNDEKAIGEASPSTFTKFGCEQVRRYLPEARLICILRHPVEVGYSAFLHRRRDGVEPEKDFLTAFQAHQWRRKQNWSPMLIYRRNYSKTIKHWLSCFPREKFRFYLTEDLQRDAMGLVRDLYRFLEVDDTFHPDLARHNSAYSIRFPLIEQFLSDSKQQHLAGVIRKMIPTTLRGPLEKRLTRWNRSAAPPMNRQLRNELTREFRDDILLLQDLIGRDLSHWLRER